MTKDKTIFSMDLVACMAVAELAGQAGKPPEEMLLGFMASETARMLYDDTTKLWWEGPSAVAERYRLEQRKS